VEKRKNVEAWQRHGDECSQLLDLGSVCRRMVDVFAIGPSTLHWAESIEQGVSRVVCRFGRGSE